MKRTRLTLSTIFKRAGLTFAAAIFLAGLDHFGLFEKPEYLTRDWRFRAREILDRNHEFDPRVRVIGITDADLATLGRWPWRRDFHGEMVSLLHASGADVIAFDILFIEESEDTEADQSFASAVASTGGKVALGAEKIIRSGMNERSPPEAFTRVSGQYSEANSENDSAILLPYDALSKAGKIGFVNADADPDGGRRELPLIEFYKGKFYPGLATRILMTYWQLEPTEIEVRLGDRIVFHTADGPQSVPIDSEGKMIVNLRSPERFLAEGVIGYVPLFQALSSHVIDGDDWNAALDVHPAGRIFVVGQVAPGLADMGPTAFQPLTPLCYLQAQAVSNILQQDFIRKPSIYTTILIWILVTLGLLLLLRNATLAASFFIPLGVVFVYLVLAIVAFTLGNLLLPMVWPVGGYSCLQFATMMRSWQRERDARIATDASLQAAAEIQLSTLPEVADLGEGPYPFDLAARLIPAQEASGDFFDFFFIDQRRLCLVVADVCDKGITAATFMLQAKTLLKSVAHQTGKSGYIPGKLGSIVIQVNQELSGKNKRSMFATALIGIYDTDTGSLEYCTAGHYPPLLRSTSGEVSELPKTGDLALGLIAPIPYHSETYQLTSGQTILCYTDGISEAFNRRGKMFGQDRLKNSFCIASSESSEHLLGDILKDLQTFTGSADQSDDITALVLRNQRNRVSLRQD